MDRPKPSPARENLTSEAVGTVASYSRFLPSWAVKDFSAALLKLAAVVYENGRMDGVEEVKPGE